MNQPSWSVMMKVDEAMRKLPGFAWRQSRQLEGLA
jgi:hypothetical protein